MGFERTHYDTLIVYWQVGGNENDFAEVWDARTLDADGEDEEIELALLEKLTTIHTCIDQGDGESTADSLREPLLAQIRGVLDEAGVTVDELDLDSE